MASATAIATRCCSPPDSLSGAWFARCDSPTSSISSSDRFRLSLLGRLVSIMGSATFSIAVRYGKRFLLVCCQMNPTSFLR